MVAVVKSTMSTLDEMQCKKAECCQESRDWKAGRSLLR